MSAVSPAGKSPYEGDKSSEEVKAIPKGTKIDPGKELRKAVEIAGSILKDNQSVTFIVTNTVGDKVVETEYQATKTGGRVSGIKIKKVGEFKDLWIPLIIPERYNALGVLPLISALVKKLQSQ